MRCINADAFLALNTGIQEGDVEGEGGIDYEEFLLSVFSLDKAATRKDALEILTDNSRHASKANTRIAALEAQMADVQAKCDTIIAMLKQCWAPAGR